MSRQPFQNQNLKLKDAIEQAIARYNNSHSDISVERQRDISCLREMLNDQSREDVQKHVAIQNYMKSIQVGFFGRSDLRRYVLIALEVVSLERLVDEFVRRHEARLHTRAMRIHAQAPKESIFSEEIVSSSYKNDVQKLEAENKKLKEKVKKLSSSNKRLLEKYQTLKKEHHQVCKKHGEFYSPSDTTSGSYLKDDSDFNEDMDLPYINETQEEEVFSNHPSTSYDQNQSAFFKKEKNCDSTKEFEMTYPSKKGSINE